MRRKVELKPSHRTYLPAFSSFCCKYFLNIKLNQNAITIRQHPGNSEAVVE